MPPEPPSSGDVDRDALLARLQAAKSRIAPKLPDMDPGDLDLILMSLMRPFGSGRRFFLREIRAGVYVF